MIYHLTRTSTIFVCLVLTGLTWGAMGCNAQPRDNTRRAGQSCVQDSDCVGNLTCRRRTCVPTSQRYSDAGTDPEGDATSNADAETDGGMSGDGAAPDVRTDTGDDVPDEEENTGVGEGGEVG